MMPTLKDTEWRLVCVIVRQTLGWSAGQGRRKSQDWLTQKQIMRRTERNNGAISKAIAVLVRRGLIEVLDASGALLVTAQQRRRSYGRLYYRLAASTLPQHSPQSASLTAETAVRKAQTTKARVTKYIPYGSASNEGLVSAAVLTPHEVNATLMHGIASVETNPEVPLEAPNPDVRIFLGLYIRLFKHHTLRHDPPCIAWGKDGKLVRDLLKCYPLTRLESLLEQFFDSREEWLQKQGYSIGAFAATINTLLIRESYGTKYEPELRTGQWSKVGPPSPLAQRHQKPKQRS